MPAAESRCTVHIHSLTSPYHVDREDQAALATVAAAHEVCPYYLSQELARWSDVIIGDYNYYFDHSAFLYDLAQEQGWRVGVLVDLC